jgi:hypothetical protein
VSDVTFRFVTANQAPDHGTIARFRKTHEQALKDMHHQVLVLCASVGLVQVGVVALDGTKIAADASRSANRTMSWLDEQIAGWFTEADRVDTEEDDRHGEARGDETPADLADRDVRLRRLREARDRLAEETKKKGPKSSGGQERRVNVTDPESGLVPTQQGFIQGYNAQAVATTSRVVVATGLDAAPGDVGWLIPMLDTAAAAVAAAGVTETIGTMVADAGYWSTANLARVPADDGPEVLIATGSRKDLAEPAPDTSARDAARAAAEDKVRTERDHRRQVLEEWIAGRIDYRQAAARIGVRSPRIYELRWAYEADPEDRLGVKDPPRGPTRARSDARAEMRAKLDSERGRELYGHRAPLIEGVFADRKHRLGFRRFSRRGRAAAEAEWAFINTVGNLDKTRRAATALMAFLTGQPA